MRAEPLKRVKLQSIDTFKLWYWRRLLRVPWTARRSNQLILKEINPEYSLEGLTLKLKLQYFGHLMCRADLLEKTIMQGKIEGRRRRDDRGWDGWMVSPTQRIWVWANSKRWWRTGKPGVLQPLRSQSWAWRSYWATVLFTWSLSVLGQESVCACLWSYLSRKRAGQGPILLIIHSLHRYWLPTVYKTQIPDVQLFNLTLNRSQVEWGIKVQVL